MMTASTTSVGRQSMRSISSCAKGMPKVLANPPTNVITMMAWRKREP